MDEPRLRTDVSACNGMASERMSSRNLLIIFVIALTMRGAWHVFREMQRGTAAGLEFPDEQQYWRIAQSLAAGDGLRDELGFRAGRMPLYPAFLSLFTGFDHGLVVVRSVQWITGALTACLAAILAARLGGRMAGLLAGLAVALDPFQIFFASLLLTEVPFAAALLLLMYWLVRMQVDPASRRMETTADAPNLLVSRLDMSAWLAAGAVAAICVYLRESSLGMVVILFSFVAIRKRTRQGTLGAMIASAIVAVSLLPWALRNRDVLGEYVFLTTRGGISLYDGLGPQADGSSDLGDIKDAPEVQHKGELERNRHFLRESLRHTRENPGRIARLALKKAARTWSPVPNAEGYRSTSAAAASAAWSLPLYVLALAGAVVLIGRGCGGMTAFLLLPAAYFTILHMFFVGSVRYRIPVMPLLEILAAIALSAAAASLTARQTRSSERR